MRLSSAIILSHLIKSLDRRVSLLVARYPLVKSRRSIGISQAGSRPRKKGRKWSQRMSFTAIAARAPTPPFRSYGEIDAYVYLDIAICAVSILEYLLYVASPQSITDAPAFCLVLLPLPAPSNSRYYWRVEYVHLSPLTLLASLSSHERSRHSGHCTQYALLSSSSQSTLDHRIHCRAP